MKVSDFHYQLPDSAIAQSAVEPRHNARLLDARDLSDHFFWQLPALLQEGDLLVVNDTRVRAARLQGTRVDTGGRIELLLLEKTPDGKWEALARPSRRLRTGIRIELDEMIAEVVAGPVNGMVTLHLEATDAEEVIARTGSMPLPPYFSGALTSSDRYQTVFANRPGSAAAPTAGLHFTEQVIRDLSTARVDVVTVDLHVSLDTFRPMMTRDVEDHLMHSEWCSISAETASAIAGTRDNGGRVIAVGTTVVRTLESMSNGTGGVNSGEMRTNLFLTPGSEFTVVDGLVTNFHMPSSTLLVLLAAFMGPDWRSAYEVALDRGYRFLSFGDAMICFRDHI